MTYITVHTQDYSADTSALWENTLTQYSTPTDTDFPFVSASKLADLTMSAGPTSENVVSFTTIAGYQAFNGYGPFDATCGRVTVDMRVTTANATAMGTSQYTVMFQLKGSPDTSGVGNVSIMFKKASISGSTLSGTWRLLYNNHDAVVGTVGAGTIGLDTWYRYTLTWTCGSNPVEVALFSPPTADSDGTITVTQQPSAGGTIDTLFSVASIPLYTGPGVVFSGGSGGFSALNENNDFEMAAWGDFTNIVIARCASSLRGSFVAGVTTTVTADRAIAFGLDGNVNTHSTAGTFKVFGDMDVTGDFVTPDGNLSAGTMSDRLDGLGT